ncbi:hypothetical protein DCE93_05350 [Agromyces badenianii]|uniref:Uncharacterized protein n=1 Tax=Agromyces badenianii TaxID=2080742 RepID=A0A2S0WV23_9MICO|nr:hypothetical protein DCE93_05350 [Agromyces badenianii]
MTFGERRLVRLAPDAVHESVGLGRHGRWRGPRDLLDQEIPVGGVGLLVDPHVPGQAQAGQPT